MDSLTLQRVLPKTFVATRISILLIVKTTSLHKAAQCIYGISYAYDVITKHTVL